MTKHRLQQGGASNDEQVAREPFDDPCQSIPVLPCCHGNNKEGDIKSTQTKDWQIQTSVKITGTKWTVSQTIMYNVSDEMRLKSMISPSVLRCGAHSDKALKYEG